MPKPEFKELEIFLKLGVRELVDSFPGAMFIKDSKNRFVLANRAFETICGYSQTELKALDCGMLTPPRYAQEEARQLEALKTKGTFGPYQTEYVRKDDTSVPVQLSGALTIGDDGQAYTWSIVEDITQRKATEFQLRASLLEKEALLREVHHRVKNNLQVITSLLRLEGSRTKHEETQSVLRDMQGRIRSMALVHELLYKSEAFASVDLGHYVNELARQVFRTMAPPGKKIQLVLNTRSVAVRMEQATPCGLIINELLLNCLKHAFPDGRSGEVCVSLVPMPESGALMLTVGDDGVGMDTSHTGRTAGSLGMQLVNDLSQQLGGSLTILETPGRTVALQFVPNPLQT